ncbi:hypothetical protein GCM10020000_46170 [Streptomyces olivoverticillatus]
MVQLVCVEPPAYAEECGALRPVVESLMRKEPSERPEFEELRGWLRSLIRSAPEPDIGSRTVTVPSIGPGLPADPGRLPVIRRRGELVRRRRGRAAAADAASAHGRHKRAPGRERAGSVAMGHLQEQRVRTAPAPRRLGRLLLGLILLALVGAVLYALLFMPRAEQSAGQTPCRPQWQRGSDECRAGRCRGRGYGRASGGHRHPGEPDGRRGRRRQGVHPAQGPQGLLRGRPRRLAAPR